MQHGSVLCSSSAPYNTLGITQEPTPAAARMKAILTRFATLAAVSYALFAAIGFAVWQTLLFTAVPKGTSRLGLLWDMLFTEPHAEMLRAHVVATLLATIFAVLLLAKPPVTPSAHMCAFVVSFALASTAWLVFVSDVAILPTVAAATLALGWFDAIRVRRQSDA